MKTLIKYPGSKWRIAEWIISFFPEHHSYLEPFFGSGAVLFNKKRSHIETINDMDGDVMNFFDWVKRDPERLASAVWKTPYSRKEYDRSFQKQKDDFQRALSFCVKLNMGHGFRTSGGKVGWKMDVQGRERAYALRDWNQFPERIIEAAARLKEVQIECRPALDVIRRFDFENVLIYADPPYLLETRYGKQYRKEMSEKDHIELLETLTGSKAKVILSGYESSLYDKMLDGWQKTYINSITQNPKKKGREVIYMNFVPEKQMELF